MTTEYPLQWPHGFARTKGFKPARFSTSITGAVKNVMEELRRFGKDSGKMVTDITISSNFSLGVSAPKDPGVAVYLKWDGIDCCIPVDIYPKPEFNLQAIAKIVEAERTKLRHGGLNIVRATFRGFAALPPPKSATAALIDKPWWTRLGFSSKPLKSELEKRYRELAKSKHPDSGGSAAEFNLIVEAVREGRAEIG